MPPYIESELLAAVLWNAVPTWVHVAALLASDTFLALGLLCSNLVWPHLFLLMWLVRIHSQLPAFSLLLQE